MFDGVMFVSSDGGGGGGGDLRGRLCVILRLRLCSGDDVSLSFSRVGVGGTCLDGIFALRRDENVLDIFSTTKTTTKIFFSLKFFQPL